MRSGKARETGGDAQQNVSLRGQTMKRLHVHVSVGDLSHSIGFCSASLARTPSACCAPQVAPATSRACC